MRYSIGMKEPTGILLKIEIVAYKILALILGSFSGMTLFVSNQKIKLESYFFIDTSAIVSDTYTTLVLLEMVKVFIYCSVIFFLLFCTLHMLTTFKSDSLLYCLYISYNSVMLSDVLRNFCFESNWQ